MCSVWRSEYASLAAIARREVIAALRRAGFSVVRVRGSLRHVDGRTTVVPVHAGETIGPGLLKQIVSDVEMEPQEFEDWL